MRPRLPIHQHPERYPGLQRLPDTRTNHNEPRHPIHSGSGIRRPNGVTSDLIQITKLTRWGLQAYVRGQAQVLDTYDVSEMQIIRLNVQGFTISAVYIPPETSTDQLSVVLNKPEIQRMVLASDMVMGDFNMHTKGYLARRDDARAKLIRPLM